MAFQSISNCCIRADAILQFHHPVSFILEQQMLGCTAALANGIDHLIRLILRNAGILGSMNN